jgi:hypothetical protein
MRYPFIRICFNLLSACRQAGLYVQCMLNFLDPFMAIKKFRLVHTREEWTGVRVGNRLILLPR